VGEIRLGGTASRQIEIRLKPQALQQTGVSIEQITQSLRSMNLNTPVGEVRGPFGDAVVRVDGRMKSVADFQNMVVMTKSTERGAVTVRLSQVADVIDAERETADMMRFNGAAGYKTRTW
jgi:hydrophobic/amphiphilic exporter-1 (mainly G- bacteria), HAE1 family